MLFNAVKCCESDRHEQWCVMTCHDVSILVSHAFDVKNIFASRRFAQLSSSPSEPWNILKLFWATTWRHRFYSWWFRSAVPEEKHIRSNNCEARDQGVMGYDGIFRASWGSGGEFTPSPGATGHFTLRSGTLWQCALVSGRSIGGASLSTWGVRTLIFQCKLTWRKMGRVIDSHVKEWTRVPFLAAGMIGARDCTASSHAAWFAHAVGSPSQERLIYFLFFLNCLDFWNDTERYTKRYKKVQKHIKTCIQRPSGLDACSCCCHH